METGIANRKSQIENCKLSSADGEFQVVADHGQRQRLLNPKSAIRNQKFRAFTLVEMLVVIAIIGILVALLTVAAGPAMNMVRNWRMKAEITQLALAIEEVKNKLGSGTEYPPDGTNAADTQRFYKRAFPRATATFPTGLTPATALRFWLAGPYGTGFSADPKNPLDLDSNGNPLPEAKRNPARIGPFFEFDKVRFGKDPVTRVDNGTYLPQNERQEDTEPYCYFKAVGKEYCQVNQPSGGNPAKTGWSQAGWQPNASKDEYVKPFTDSTQTGTWVNPSSCQIVCPGLDGVFGKYAKAVAAPAYPLGSNYLPATRDDLTNFANGRVEDDAP